MNHKELLIESLAVCAIWGGVWAGVAHLAGHPDVVAVMAAVVMGAIGLMLFIKANFYR